MKMEFSREDTKVIKGVAIVWMLIHHLWPFEDRIAGGLLRYKFSIFGEPSIVYLGLFGKICVTLFFFLGGYGIYCSSKGKAYDIVGRIKGLYVEFWKIFLIFIPIGFLFFRNQPSYCQNALEYSRFKEFSWNEFFQNFLGINTTYNGEWWFLFSYIFAIITFPFIRNIIDKHNACVNVALVIVAEIVSTSLLPALGSLQTFSGLMSNSLYRYFFVDCAPYIACFWMGISFAKDDLLVRLMSTMKKNKLLNPLVDILIWMVIIYLRQTALGIDFDIFYMPFLIVTALDFLNHFSILKKVFGKLGKESTGMWLIHSFFCYYYYLVVKIVVGLRWAMPCLLVLIILSYVASLLVTSFWKLLEKLVSFLGKVINHTEKNDV